jgi:hypothetical protein
MSKITKAKRAGGVAQVVAGLARLNLSPRTTHTQKKKLCHLQEHG